MVTQKQQMYWDSLKGKVPKNIGILLSKLKGNQYTLGREPWNKGKKGLQVGANSGKVFSIERRVQLSLAHGGDGKLGKRTERTRFMERKEYILWRTAVFMRDDYTCQSCKVKGGKLEADHIKPYSRFPQLRLAIDNGRTLCVACHRQTKTWGRRVMSYV